MTLKAIPGSCAKPTGSTTSNKKQVPHVTVYQRGTKLLAKGQIERVDFPRYLRSL